MTAHPSLALPPGHPDRITDPPRVELHNGRLVHAPDVATVELQTLLGWHRQHAAHLIADGAHGCAGGVCAGHVPTAPIVGEHLVLGQRGDRAVYRVAQLLPGTKSVRIERIA